MTDNTSTATATKAEADLIIRDRAAAYVDEFGGDHTLDGFEFWAVRLSEDVGAPLDRGWLAEVLFHMEQVTAVENGHHPLIQRNAAQTVDNTGAVYDFEAEALTKTIHALLKLAGFSGALSTGKQAA